MGSKGGSVVQVQVRPHSSLFQSTLSTCKIVLLCAFVVASHLQAQQLTSLASGAVRGKIVNITCAPDPSQSYALYLPSNYSPDRRWPIIYAFDPFARGTVPVELYKRAAEKYGYIVAGSNNAKNGPGSLEMAAAQ